MEPEAPENPWAMDPCEPSRGPTSRDIRYGHRILTRLGPTHGERGTDKDEGVV